MTTIELLQQTGLNKYEAEAYYTLLVEGSLTGYELGKRSQVPLSRSYEILERLTQKGLALVQPGDPPRYAAERPERYLDRVRSGMLSTVDALAKTLATLPSRDAGSEFWVVRGRQPVLERARAMIAEAERTIAISLPIQCHDEVAEVLTHAGEHGRHLFRSSPVLETGEAILLLVDEREALVGTLAPIAQAVTSQNRALVAALSSYFAHPATTGPVQQSNWLDWEERKQRRLWSLDTRTA